MKKQQGYKNNNKNLFLDKRFLLYNQLHVFPYSRSLQKSRKEKGNKQYSLTVTL